MKRTVAFLICFIVLAVSVIIPGSAQSSELKFKDDGKFRIMVFSDTQDDQSPAPDMLNFVRKSIEETSPDLIIFTGDLVEDSRLGDKLTDNDPLNEGVVVKKNGEIDHDATKENVIRAVEPIFEILEDSGIPYALVQGNNDYKVAMTNEEWLEFYSAYPNCLIRDDSPDEDGRIDYNLEIKGKDGNTAFNIWMLDTGKYGINDDQIEWYRAASSQMTEKNGGVPVPAILFQHIYTSDIGNLFEKCSMFDDGAGCVNGKYYRLNREIAHGYNFFTYEPGTVSEEFKAWKEQGDIIGAFFGHQHVEGFSGVYDGIELGFTYGCEFAKPGPYGIRVIDLDENDITNYGNELYRYKGSVKMGNDRFEKQVDEKEYPVYNNIIEKAFAGSRNFILSIVSFVISLFA